MGFICLEIGKITNLTYKGGPFFMANPLRREKDTYKLCLISNLANFSEKAQILTS